MEPKPIPAQRSCRVWRRRNGAQWSEGKAVESGGFRVVRRETLPACRLSRQFSVAERSGMKLKPVPAQRSFLAGSGDGGMKRSAAQEKLASQAQIKSLAASVPAFSTERSGEGPSGLAPPDPVMKAGRLAAVRVCGARRFHPVRTSGGECGVLGRSGEGGGASCRPGAEHSLPEVKTDLLRAITWPGRGGASPLPSFSCGDATVRTGDVIAGLRVGHQRSWV